MSLIIRTFECENCGQFDLMQDREDAPPTECPHCAKPEVQGPIPSTTAVGQRLASKATDGMYRQVEEGSAVRAEIAGDPSLKVTDMHDGFYGGGLKEGDVAAKPVHNTVTAVADATGHQYWGAGGSMAQAGLTPQNIIAGTKANRRGGEAPGAMAMAAIQGKSGPMSTPAVHPAIMAGSGFGGGGKR